MEQGNSRLGGLAAMRCCFEHFEWWSSRLSVAGDIRRMEGWLPNQEVEWFANVQQGQPFPETDPFIIRRATVGERPAVWYLEDGSGRGTAIVGNASLFIPLGAVAHAYLGTRVDPTSSFMQRKGFS
jgi:hypothetical protein